MFFLYFAIFTLTIKAEPSLESLQSDLSDAQTSFESKMGELSLEVSTISSKVSSDWEHMRSQLEQKAARATVAGLTSKMEPLETAVENFENEIKRLESTVTTAQESTTNEFKKVSSDWENLRSQLEQKAARATVARLTNKMEPLETAVENFENEIKRLESTVTTAQESTTIEFRKLNENGSKVQTLVEEDFSNLRKKINACATKTSVNKKLQAKVESVQFLTLSQQVASLAKKTQPLALKATQVDDQLSKVTVNFDKLKKSLEKDTNEYKTKLEQNVNHSLKAIAERVGTLESEFETGQKKTNDNFKKVRKIMKTGKNEQKMLVDKVGILENEFGTVRNQGKNLQKQIQGFGDQAKDHRDQMLAKVSQLENAISMTRKDNQKLKLRLKELSERESGFKVEFQEMKLAYKVQLERQSRKFDEVLSKMQGETISGYLWAPVEKAKDLAKLIMNAYIYVYNDVFTTFFRENTSLSDLQNHFGSFYGSMQEASNVAAEKARDFSKVASQNAVEFSSYASEQIGVFFQT